jgi:hypothetical protein
MTRSASVGVSAPTATRKRVALLGHTSATGLRIASTIRRATCCAVCRNGLAVAALKRRPLRASAAWKKSVSVPIGSTVVTAMSSGFSSTRIASAMLSWAAFVAE